MAPYTYNYEKDLNYALLMYMQYMNLYYPPYGNDFILLNKCVKNLRETSDRCAEEAEKQSLRWDKECCDNVATTICALAQMLESFIDKYK